MPGRPSFMRGIHRLPRHAANRTVRTLDGPAGLLAAGLDVHLRYPAGPEAERAEAGRDYESGIALPGPATVEFLPPLW